MYPYIVLPARAGMSPTADALSPFRYSAPRASGDEPRGGGVRRVRGKCSPRERG